VSQPLDATAMQRLAFIRYLYDQGMGQVDQPEPLSSTAILSFHDAVELFLRLSAEHLKVNLPSSVNFAEYWDRLQPKLPPGSPLPSKNPMERMNKLRVAFKHHGIIPSATALEQARGDVTTFFTDATCLVFQLDFARIDMIDLVSHGETAQILRDAQTHADIGDYPTALAGLAVAFDKLLANYSYQDYEYTPFGFGPKIQRFTSHGLDSFTQHLEDMSTATKAMQEAMTVITLGIDYRKYALFKLQTPHLIPYMNGKVEFVFTAAQDASSTQKEYNSCRAFIIESALQAAHSDGYLHTNAVHNRINSQPNSAQHRNLGEWRGPA
jgi:hypothetical protein